MKSHDKILDRICARLLICQTEGFWRAPCHRSDRAVIPATLKQFTLMFLKLNIWTPQKYKTDFYDELITKLLFLKPFTRFTIWTSPPSNTMSSPWSPVPLSCHTTCPNWRPWNEPNTTRVREYGTPLWSTPPPLFYAPHTRRPANPSLAQACMRTPMLAGPLLVTVPTPCLEDRLCWDELQRVYSIIILSTVEHQVLSYLLINIITYNYGVG